MRTSILIGPATLCAAVLLSGARTRIASRDYCRMGRHGHAVRFAWRPVYGHCGRWRAGGAWGHSLALKSDGTDEVLSEAAALSRSPPHVNKPAAIRRINIPAQRTGYCGWPLEGADDALAASEALSNSRHLDPLGASRILHEEHSTSQTRPKPLLHRVYSECNPLPA
jgi:hypothetical protein